MTAPAIFLAMLLCLLCACGGGSPGPHPSAPGSGRGAHAGQAERGAEAEAVAEAPTEAAAEAPRETDAIPRCGARPIGEALTSFGGISEGPALRHVIVHHDEASGGWVPRDRIEMPMHTATRLVWDNLGEFGPLDSAREEELRFTFRVLSRRAHRRAGDNLLIEIRARVEVMCSVSAPAARAEGALGASAPSDPLRCGARRDAITAAAREAAACTSDDECTIIHVGVCEVEGLGCYWAALSGSRPETALRAAIAELEASECPSVDCDCEAAPTAARCLEGLCAAR